MLMVTQLIGFGAVATEEPPPFSVFLGGQTSSSSPFNNFNLTSFGLGSEDPSRQILVMVYGGNANVVSDTNFTTAVSVGGVGVTRISQPSASTSRHHTAWLTPRQDSGGPTGATGTITASRSTGNGYNTCGVVVYALYNRADPALAIHSEIRNAGNPTASGTFDVAHGMMIFGICQQSSSPGFAWGGSGIDETYDNALGVGGTQRLGSARRDQVAGNAAYSVTATGAGAATTDMLAISIA